MKCVKTLVAMVIVLAMTLAMSTAAMAEGAIKVGLIGPITGPAANYGLSVEHGAELAAKEINEAEGAEYFELRYEDDEHDPEKSVNAYNTLWDWGAQMIVGSVTTTPCIAVSAEAYNDRMFLLTPSASSTEVTEGKDNVFQICFTDPSQGKLSAECISEKALGTKIAVIYNNADAYSTGIYQTFEAEAQALGLEIVSVTTFTDDTTDFSVQVTSAKEAGADLVFLPMYYTPASMILKTADSMGYKPVFFGVDGMDGILNIEGFDTSLAEGVMVLTPFAGDSANEQAKAFIANYEAAYGATPDQFAADAYDAMYTLYAATKAAGVTADTSTEDACEMLVAAMKDLKINGVTGMTGEMTWNENGEVNKAPIVVKIVNGAYVTVE